MSFPYHDPNWNEAAEFLDARLRPGDRVLAPDIFWWRLPCPIERWVTSNVQPGRTYDWVVSHKGELDQFPRRFLEGVAATMHPAFANDVFVIWAAADPGSRVDPESSHVRAWHETVSGLPDEPIAANAYEQDRVFRAEPVLARFADMSDADLRAAENEFFAQGGYRYVTAKDRAYYEDVHAHLERALARWAGGRVLDLACGARALAGVRPSTHAVRIDFAEQGVRLAAVADAGQRSVVHATMDGHALGFPDGCFDGVAFVDAIEHVRDADRVLAEAARVLRPGGELLVTYANRNSMNLVVNRKLGYPDFMTNHQHIREFTAAEMAGLLDRVGLDVVETAGVSLLPYWGIPGIDEVVREITDDDPEVVDMMRVVGERAGAEYAYAGVAIARRRPTGGTP